MDSRIDVLQRIENGDVSAEQNLVNQFWKPLYFIMLRRCQNSALAEDIVQDSFIIALKQARLGKIANPEAIAAYLCSVAENVLIAHFRKERRRATDTNDDLDIHWPDNHFSPDHLCTQQQLIDIVHQVVSEMSVERDKTLLRAYFLAGQSKNQICKSLALSSEHFDRVLHRAKQRLRQQLAIKCNVDPAVHSLSELLPVLLFFLIHQVAPIHQEKIAIQVGGVVWMQHINYSHSASLQPPVAKWYHI